MSVGRLAAVGVAVGLACGAAWGQAPGIDLPKPAYDEAFAAVSDAGCARTETATFIRFVCEEGKGGAVWYFTRAESKHPLYRALPAEKLMQTGRVPEIHNSVRFDSAEERDAYLAWSREMIVDWSQSMPIRRPAPAKRDRRGKLYPLEP